MQYECITPLRVCSIAILARSDGSSICMPLGLGQRQSAPGTSLVRFESQSIKASGTSTSGSETGCELRRRCDPHSRACHWQSKVFGGGGRWQWKMRYSSLRDIVMNEKERGAILSTLSLRKKAVSYTETPSQLISPAAPGTGVRSARLGV